MDLEKAKLNPAAVFKSPQEVVSSQELSREQKIESFANENRRRYRWGSQTGRTSLVVFTVLHPTPYFPARCRAL